MIEWRITDKPGECPTNKHTTFYFPEVKIDGKWKCLHGRNQGMFITSVDVMEEGQSGWANYRMAERTISMYRTQILA